MHEVDALCVPATEGDRRQVHGRAEGRRKIGGVRKSKSEGDLLEREIRVQEVALRAVDLDGFQVAADTLAGFLPEQPAEIALAQSAKRGKRRHAGRAAIVTFDVMLDQALLPGSEADLPAIIAFLAGGGIARALNQKRVPQRFHHGGRGEARRKRLLHEPPQKVRDQGAADVETVAALGRCQAEAGSERSLQKTRLEQTPGRLDLAAGTPAMELRVGRYEKDLSDLVARVSRPAVDVVALCLVVRRPEQHGHDGARIDPYVLDRARPLALQNLNRRRRRPDLGHRRQHGSSLSGTRNVPGPPAADRRPHSDLFDGTVPEKTFLWNGFCRDGPS